ncbi:MAG: FAD binding domain-containing protein [Pleurocapsa minor GSE-CHR-MK-17-07R]|jgi:carbon-monoxide dehydrogenase medium subunit|nr:FAD binding domain-containing protein [Pleurocapsa minor GSE-CHR-MK 17-07R]
MATLQYFRPKSLPEITSLWADYPDALLLSGGALTLNALDVPASVVVDVQEVPGLKRVEPHDSGLTVGGAVTLARLLEQPSVPNAFHHALARALSPNVLNNTSVMESLSNRNHPLLAEWLTVLAAHDVGIEVFFPATGAQVMTNFETLLDDPAFGDAVAISLFIPHLGARQALATAHVARTPADRAIVCAAAFAEIDASGMVTAAFVALAGASAHPVLALELDGLIGGPLNSETIAAASAGISGHTDPPDDYLGSAEYRAHMAQVCTARALRDIMHALAHRS